MGGELRKGYDGLQPQAQRYWIGGKFLFLALHFTVHKTCFRNVLDLALNLHDTSARTGE